MRKWNLPLTFCVNSFFQLGMKQLKTLGQFLRQRYNGYLTETYLKEEVRWILLSLVLYHINACSVSLSLCVLLLLAVRPEYWSGSSFDECWVSPGWTLSSTGLPGLGSRDTMAANTSTHQDFWSGLCKLQILQCTIYYTATVKLFNTKLVNMSYLTDLLYNHLSIPFCAL